MILPNENHIMLDLETLDTAASAVVLSIGLARFSLDGGVTDTADIALRIDDQEEVGRTSSEATLTWWDQQSDEAKATIARATNCETDTHETLVMLGDWLGPNPFIWGNGAAFDNAIMQNLYESFNIEPPWKFWNNRCYRTLKDLGERCIAGLHIGTAYPGGIDTLLGPVPVRRGTHHNAMDDAIHQAECAIRYLKAIAL